MYAKLFHPHNNPYDSLPHLVNIQKWQPGWGLKTGQVTGMPLCHRPEPLTVTEKKFRDVRGLRTVKFAIPAAFDPTDPKTWTRPVIFT